MGGLRLKLEIRLLPAGGQGDFATGPGTEATPDLRMIIGEAGAVRLNWDNVAVFLGKFLSGRPHLSAGCVHIPER